jgi:Zn-dependent alcohol dehydrogenase
MRAALLEPTGRPLTVVDDIDVKDPGPGDVLVKVHACGVCHSDLSNVNGTFPVPGPIVLGHEAAGVVEAAGARVTGLKAGDRVVISPIATCGNCYTCLRGDFGVCEQAMAVNTGTFIDGTSPLSRGGVTVYRGLGVGGFGEYSLVHESAAVRIAEDTPLDVACMIGCSIQTGVGAVINTAKVEPGSTVLVIGLGGVGIAIAQGARLAGASRIIVSDPVASRRDAAAKFGATDAIDPGTEDIVSRVLAITGVGVDYAFEAVGRGALVDQAIWTARPGGMIVMVGAAPITDAVTINPAVVFMASEKKLVGSFLGSCNSRRDIPRLLGLWRGGHLDLEGMITHRRPITEVNEAFADMEAGVGLRTVLTLDSTWNST